MKVMKWVCRYAFFALLLAAAIAWCLYCNGCITDLKGTVYSTEYIDLAASLSTDAIALLSQISYYEELLQTGIWVSVIIGVCLLLLIAYHITSSVVVKKMAEKKAFAEAQAEFHAANAPEAAPSKETVEGAYCISCGQYYEEKPAFCTECGASMEDL